MDIKILDDIKDAEKVLVGIGFEWNERAEKKHYEKLKELLADKDYYILTLCMDDAIYDVFDDEERIVAPCGGKRFMQCDQHIVSMDEVVRDGDKCLCPVCGKSMDYNWIKNPDYLEEYYLPKFAEYKKWLMGTVNRKLCLLELGAGMEYPSVIRFAFDKTFLYNHKASFYRINDSLPQMTKENAERGVSVKCDSVEFVGQIV